MGEFLNVLLGKAAFAAAREGRHFKLAPTDYEADPEEGWTVGLAVGIDSAALFFGIP